MTRTHALLSAITIVAMASPLQGQWAIDNGDENKIAWSTGTHGQMRLAVSCQKGTSVVSVTLRNVPNAGNANVEAQWDDGSREHFKWGEGDGVLYKSAQSLSTTALVTKLRQRSTLRLRVQGARGRSTMDHFDLTGSFRAIGSLSCGTSVHAASSRQTRHTAAPVRDILIRKSIAAYSGSCPCPYNKDKAGRRCGGRSAYSRPGGASPLCFPRDVSDAAVVAYRRSALVSSR